MNATLSVTDEIVHFTACQQGYRARFPIQLSGVKNDEVFAVFDIRCQGETQGAAIEIGDVHRLLECRLRAGVRLESEGELVEIAVPLGGTGAGWDSRNHGGKINNAPTRQTLATTNAATSLPVAGSRGSANGLP